MTEQERNQIKAEAIKELLSEAQKANTRYNASVVQRNEMAQIVPFTAISVTQCNRYISKLKDSHD